MTNEEKVIDESLKICIKIAKILKDEFPNEIMAIRSNTIIAYSKHSRLIRANSADDLDGLYAYYTNYTPHRIVISRQTLLDRKVASTYGKWVFPKYVKKKIRYIFPKCSKCKLRFDDEIRYKLRKERTDLHGLWALADLLLHECSHHCTSKHRKSWKLKYTRFLQFMANQFISGEFYRKMVADSKS